MSDIVTLLAAIMDTAKDDDTKDVTNGVADVGAIPLAGTATTYGAGDSLTPHADPISEWGEQLVELARPYIAVMLSPASFLDGVPGNTTTGAKGEYSQRMFGQLDVFENEEADGEGGPIVRRLLKILTQPYLATKGVMVEVLPAGESRNPVDLANERGRQMLELELVLTS